MVEDVGSCTGPGFRSARFADSSGIAVLLCVWGAITCARKGASCGQEPSEKLTPLKFSPPP
eukprot:CAMPEP_0115069240 /NCGR_PEP_ID=MMETSP0227-20121206/12449_1 /TAXON_ID=89957 /ORGANISM="Polarella glacialis, Strain CCMP 1383" /LENGTH=60 /DNA_ID=CAMNT_0002455623 /DNA_START=328 /DNA_END=510 /DNA_ORIENTATION=-